MRRNSVEIMIDILESCAKGGQKITWICGKANLSYASHKPYIKRLLKNGLLTVKVTSGCGRSGKNYVYFTTPKGLEAIKLYRQIERLLGLKEDE